MGKMAFVAFLFLMAILLGTVGISWLVVFWRNTLRKWKREAKKDQIQEEREKRKQLKEALSDVYSVDDTVEDIKNKRKSNSKVER